MGGEFGHVAGRRQPYPEESPGHPRQRIQHAYRSGADVSKAQLKKNRALKALDDSGARSNREEEVSVSCVEPLIPRDRNSNSFARIFPTH